MIESVIKLKPYVKTALWGGNYFQKFGKSDLDVVAELWELSLRGECSSIVASGPYEGKRLDEVASKEDFGPSSNKYSFFPVLIKLIDAENNLSIQVHPSDSYALRKENSFGKSEMWHILESEKDAKIYIGFNKDYSKEEIEKFLKEGTIIQALNEVHVKEGETYIIDPGTVHAICAGVRLIEIQQNSDLTYRLYDYLRKDKDGNYRELHIEKALNVLNFKKYENKQKQSNYLANNQYFKVKKIELNGEMELDAHTGSFISFTFISGKGKVDDIEFKQYDTFFLPYKKKCKIKGEGTLVVVNV